MILAFIGNYLPTMQDIIHSERKKLTQSNTTNPIQSILLPCVFSIEYELPIFTQLLYLAWYHHWVTHCYIYSPCHPHAMGSNPPSSFLLPLVAWRSRKASLYRCTRREIATWVVTDIVWKRCSSQTLFLVKDPPSVPPTMLAANLSMSSLPSFPRHPKLSTARVTSSLLRSLKDTCPTRA